MFCQDESDEKDECEADKDGAVARQVYFQHWFRDGLLQRRLRQVVQQKIDSVKRDGRSGISKQELRRYCNATLASLL